MFFILAHKKGISGWLPVIHACLVCVALTCKAWGATGQVLINSPLPSSPGGVVEVTSGFSVEGTYILEEDSTPTGEVDWESCSIYHRACLSPTYWNNNQWEAVYAELDYKIDGVPTGKIDSLVYWYGPNPGDELGQVFTFSVYIDINGLEPGLTHEVTVSLEDIIGFRCWERAYKCGSWTAMRGDVIDSDKLLFTIPLGIIKPKNFGGEPCPKRTHAFAGNPVNVATGNKYQKEIDLPSGSTPLALEFTRHYNSQSETSRSLGYGWSHTYDRYLQITPDKIIAWREDGRAVYFSASTFVAESGAREKLFRNPGDNIYVLTRTDDLQEIYDSTGRLISVSDLNGNTQTMTYDDNGNLVSVADPFGRSLILAYDGSGLLQTLTDPAGNTISYAYDTDGNLTQVTYADESGKIYHYEDSNDIHNLTGITNENGIRFATFAYDGEDRATLSTHEGGADLISASYDGLTRTLTDGQGNVTTFRVLVKEGIGLTEKVTGGGCTECGGSVAKQFAYNNDLNVKSITDGNDNRTTFTYHAYGDVVERLEAEGADEERMTIHFFLPGTNNILEILQNSVFPGQMKDIFFDYDSRLNLMAKSECGYTGQDTFCYTTTYEYDSRGQVTKIDGPRNDVQDVTTFSYDEQGNVLSVTRGGKLTTGYGDYNAYGSPGRIIDTNGNETSLEYDVRNRLLSVITEAGATRYTYDPVGNVTRIELANGNSLLYGYDGANRLIRVEDGLGNRIIYSYDSSGNRTAEQVHDPSGNLTRSLHYEYDSFSRLAKVIYPDDVFEAFTYDGNGNRTGSIDANGQSTSYAYDSLNRIKQVLQPGGAVTNYTYDVADNLTSVTDAEGHLTTYTYDDAARLIETVSPDTGTTRYGYDEAGNLISRTEADGATVAYSYDSLNRLTRVDYPNDPDVIYTYDEGANGKGRLTGMTDGSGTSSYAYDAGGNLIREEKIIAGVMYITEYHYDAAGLLTGITYPDGRVVDYDLDQTGKVIRVTTTKDGLTKTLAANISYAPFGPLRGMTYGNGIPMSQSFDQRYRLTTIQAGTVLDLVYGHDEAGNITGITNNNDASRSQSFTYDALNRLGSATGLYGALAYTYDKVGNRLSRTSNGQVETYAYQAGTNRLSVAAGAGSVGFAYDANGATIALGDNGFEYGQNGRLITATLGGSPVGKYTYNGAGQRVIKRAGAEATIYHYDKDGNFIAQSKDDGTVVRSFVYLGATRLALIEDSGPQEFTVRVETSRGRTLAGLKLYAFTAGGSYTGKQGATDETGLGRFQLSDFQEGSYRFRIDYLGGRFWSEEVAIPGDSSTSVVIDEETVEVAVTTASGPRPGVKVYLFSEDGSYLGVYGETDTNGGVSFDLPVGESFKFRADLLGSQYWSDTSSVTAGGVKDVPITAGGGLFRVTVTRGPGMPMEGVKVYLFKPSGAYLGLSQVTDASGAVTFSVPEGAYKVRADYLGYQFWSAETLVALDTDADLTIPHQQVDIAVNGVFQGMSEPLEGIKCYLFSPAPSYLGQYGVSDTNGRLSFALPEKAYRIRADYLGGQFWSAEFTWQDTTIEVPMAEAEITVTGIGFPLTGVKVYAFSEAGSYLGVFGTTEADGRVIFKLPAGLYTFRADYRGNQYSSTAEVLTADEVKAITISTGGGSFTLTVEKGVAEPLAGVTCYVFNEGSSYLGVSGTTDNEGRVFFALADGTYTFRVDYLGYKFWTNAVAFPETLALTMPIPHQETMLAVEGMVAEDIQARVGVPVHLFSSAGQYLGLKVSTDSSGQVSLSLPEKPYKVRVDYLGQQFWSDEFIWQDTTVTIPEGTAQVHVSMAGQGVKDIKVYVFSVSGSYLGVQGKTDAAGIVEFRLPAGSYKFRADYQGNQYWASAGIVEDVVNFVELNAGGGEFVLSLDTGIGPLANTKVCLFSPGGSYLGISATTDEGGQASFHLASESYKFRVDYLGYQFWSPEYGVPGTLSGAMTIGHEQVVITAAGLCWSLEPLAGLRVYLFTPSGSYLGKYQVTDANGQVAFSLPDKEYKARVDYLGGQFWSEVFQSHDTAVTINEGIARVHVHRSGVELEGVKVYLFSEGGSYLGKSGTTDASGMVEFLLPDRAFKFRADESGHQYWSGVINVIAAEENALELDLDRLALETTNDPRPVVLHGMPPAYREEVRLASLTLIQGLLENMTVTAIPGGRVLYCHNDHLGTPLKLTDENGTVVWSADYDPFGEATIDEDPDGDGRTVTFDFRFPGQYYDQETGLHYNWHRYYDPQTGRYLRADPKGPAVADPNPFVYANGNPTVNIDPLGLITINGMDCTEIGRRPVPVIRSSSPVYTHSAGKIVICTDIVVEDSLSCVCIGRWQEIVMDIYEKTIYHEVQYRCCKEEECSENCAELTRIEKDWEGIESRSRYKSLPQMGTVIRPGTTLAALGGCSACPGGIGSPM